MREALAFEPEIDTDQDEGDLYEVRIRRPHKKSDENSNDSEEDFRVKGKSERRGPRLLLDDALIMVKQHSLLYSSLPTYKLLNLKKRKRKSQVMVQVLQKRRMEILIQMRSFLILKPINSPCWQVC